MNERNPRRKMETSGERLGKCMELVEKNNTKRLFLDLFIKMNRYIPIMRDG
jgi:hypothetical protein